MEMKNLLLLTIIFAFSVFGSDVNACTTKHEQVSTAATTTTTTAPQFSRCVYAKSATSRLIMCRSGASCLTTETKVPSTSFASESACTSYTAKALCYDYTTDTNTGTCNDDFNCIGMNSSKIILVGGLTDPSCGEYIPTWRRCIKYGTSGGICRPYEASCTSDEVMSPAATNVRVSGTLNARSAVLQDCKDMTPYYGCFTQGSSATPTPGNSNWGWSCQADNVQKCPTGVRIANDLLFPTSSACTYYIPVQWIKCKSTSIPDGTCMPYDASTLNACPTGYTQKGSSGVFSSYTDCATYNTYALCISSNSLQLNCASGSCASGYTLVAEYNTSAACQAAYSVQSYSRCINPTGTTNAVTCVPTAAVTSACPATTTNPLTRSPSTTYSSLSACQLESIYILCYSSTTSQLQCQQDYIGCDDLAPTNSYIKILESATFSTRAACLSYQPPLYYRCITITTGVAKCRPTPCTTAEYSTATTYSTRGDCESVNMYNYCYTSTNPEVFTPTCTLDKVGCTSPAVPLRSPTTGIPVLFDRNTCVSYPNTGSWVACVTSSSTKCRPANAETTVDATTGVPSAKSCASGETVDDSYTGLSACKIDN